MNRQLAQALLGLFIIVLAPARAYCAGERGGDSLTVSLLTCSPGTTEIYSLFGHTGLRVQTSGGGDVVFHYGVFDYDAPHFIWRFVRGETDYAIEINPYYILRSKILHHMNIVPVLSPASIVFENICLFACQMSVLFHNFTIYTITPRRCKLNKFICIALGFFLSLHHVEKRKDINKYTICHISGNGIISVFLQVLLHRHRPRKIFSRHTDGQVCTLCHVFSISVHNMAYMQIRSQKQFFRKTCHSTHATQRPAFRRPYRGLPGHVLQV